MTDFRTGWDKPELESVANLANNMVFRLPGCDDVTVRKSILDAYRDFCRRSGALRTWRKIEVTDGERSYPVVPLCGGEIDCVVGVSYRRGQESRSLSGWMVTGDPPCVTFPNWRHDEFTVAQDGDKVELWVEATEIPHMGEERAPKAFLRRYGEAIASGALARAFSMTGRMWSDPEQARQNGIAYENAVSEARMRCVNGSPASNCGNGFGLNLGGMV